MLNAKDFHVAGNGIADDTANLQMAVDTAANQRKKLYLPSGVYLISTLNIPSNTILYGDAGCSVLKRMPDSTHVGLVRIENAHAVSIAGLVIDGNKQEGASGNFGSIFVNQSYSIQLTNLKVCDGHANGIVIRNGKNEEHKSWTVITGCEIEGNAFNGISISRERRLKIDENTITKNDLNGVAVEQIPDLINFLQSSELIITANIISDNKRTGVWVSALVENDKTNTEKPLAENVLIANNTVIQNQWHGIGCQARFSTIQGNVVSRNGTKGENQFQGILVNTLSATVTGNTVTKNSGVGIDLGDCKRIVCSNNHVEENGIIGIEINGCEATTVVGNVLVGNCQDELSGEFAKKAAGILIHPDAGDEDLSFGTSLDVIVTNNIVRGGPFQNYGIRASETAEFVNISHNIEVWHI